MKEYVVAILGASGAVGKQMIEVLEEYNMPIKKLIPLASKNSIGKTVSFNGEQIEIIEATRDSFKGCDFILGAVSASASKQFLPYIKESGAIYIDNSSAFRMVDDIPLVVPEINGDDAFKHHGVIANPNCSTIITMMALTAINKISPITKAIACTYQAVSGAGKDGLDELENQMNALVNGQDIERKVFPAQIVNNVIPFIGSYTDNLYTDEEMKMQNEGRKILHNPDLKINCTCVRVPVMRSHSISVTITTLQPISVQQAKEAISNQPGVVLVDEIDNRDYPTPIDTSNQDLVYVGRIRQDLTDDNGLCLWCCGDQIRKGAASNAIQIMKLLIDRNETA